MSELDISIITIFKQYYPNVDHTTVEANTLANMIDEMFEIEKAKYSDSESDLESVNSDPEIEENYSKATELIPEMIESGDVVSIKGKLNNIDVTILFDSGCQTSSTFSSIVEKANLEHIVDKKAKTYCMGINGKTETCGMIWCTEIELKTEEVSGNYLSVPIKLSILDDIKNKENGDLDMETESNNKIDILIGTDFMKTHNVIINFNKKLVIINDVEIKY
jgi:hypothetical protein